MTSHVDNVFQARLLKIREERAWDKPWHIQEADIGLAWQCAAERCDLRARGSWLDNWILSSRQHTLDTSMDSANLIRAVSQHYAERLDVEWKYWKGDNLTILERCTVSFPRSHFTASGLSTQRSGTNGGIRWSFSSLVMLESQLHISFCVRARIVFVCHRRQINCGVVWRTELRPPIPFPSSVPPASHRSLLTRVCLPLFSYPPLSARLRLSPVPLCSLSPRSLLLWSRESAFSYELPATWSSGEQFLLSLWHLTVAEPFETFLFP